MKLKVPYSQSHNYKKVGFDQWICKGYKDPFSIWYPCDPVEFYDDNPVETLRDKLINAIAIMDEKGKLNRGENSYLLWLKDWDVMRQYLLDAVDLVDRETTNVHQ